MNPESSRFTTPRDLPAADPSSLLEAGDGPPIGLALSGGGVRAALFSLGVVFGLIESGYHRRLRCVTSVSGGSIVNAVLAHGPSLSGQPVLVRPDARHVGNADQIDAGGNSDRGAADAARISFDACDAPCAIWCAASGRAERRRLFPFAGIGHAEGTRSDVGTSERSGGRGMKSSVVAGCNLRTSIASRLTPHRV